ncbi:MAG TPA: hypothetical protein VE593_09235 [Nitrososphaeraceae archaeon]|nr:hypothetical protein [Nitrososphaeraceae archaeon]
MFDLSLPHTIDGWTDGQAYAAQNIEAFYHPIESNRIDSINEPVVNEIWPVSSVLVPS